MKAQEMIGRSFVVQAEYQRIAHSRIGMKQDFDRIMDVSALGKQLELFGSLTPEQQ